MTLLESDTAILQTPEQRRLEREGGIEFANGHVEEKPVSREGSRIAVKVSLALTLSGSNPDGWEVFDSSLGYKVFPEDPDKFRKPDVTAVLRSRLPEEDTGFLYIPADLAVEVVSPTDIAKDLEEKVKGLLAHGFRLVWVIHPTTQTVYAHTPDGDVEAFGAEDTITAGNVLPGFSCKVAEFFVK